MQHSESLLTEILLLLQNLNASVIDFQKKLAGVEQSLEETKKKFDDFVTKAFPDGLSDKHAADHARIVKVNPVRRFLRFLDGKMG